MVSIDPPLHKKTRSPTELYNWEHLPGPKSSQIVSLMRYWIYFNHPGLPIPVLVATPSKKSPTFWHQGSNPICSFPCMAMERMSERMNEILETRFVSQELINTSWDILRYFLLLSHRKFVTLPDFKKKKLLQLIHDLSVAPLFARHKGKIHSINWCCDSSH